MKFISYVWLNVVTTTFYNLMDSDITKMKEIKELGKLL